jgi:hypothetical protein
MIWLLKQQSSGVKKSWMLENLSRLDRQRDVFVDCLGEYIGEIHFDTYNYNQINVWGGFREVLDRNWLALDLQDGYFRHDCRHRSMRV